MERPDEPSLEWWCLQTEPGQFADPQDFRRETPTGFRQQCQGTAASAIRSARGTEECLAIDYDEFDWWFVTQFGSIAIANFSLQVRESLPSATSGSTRTLGRHRDSMFQRFDTTLRLPAGTSAHDSCEALAPLLKQKRPRPRWRSQLVPVPFAVVANDGARRMPGWAGFAARSARGDRSLTPRRRDHELVNRSVRTSVDSDGGLVVVDLEVTGGDRAAAAACRRRHDSLGGVWRGSRVTPDG